MSEAKEEFFDVVLTDVTLHVVEPRKPAPFSRVIEKARRSGKPFRAHSRRGPVVNKDGTIDLCIGDISGLVEQAKREGKKLRIIIPKDLRAGEDLLQYAASQERKSKRIRQK